jgi:GT2 family glycosyltransferase
MGNARMIHPKISFDEIEGSRMPTTEIWEVCLFKTAAVTESEFVRCLKDLEQSKAIFPNVQISAGLNAVNQQPSKSVGILLKTFVQFDSNFLPNMISIFARTDTSLLYSDHCVKSEANMVDIHLPAWSPIRFESIDFLGQALAFDMDRLNIYQGDLITQDELVRRAEDSRLRVSRLPRISYTATGFDSGRRHRKPELDQTNSVSIVIPTMGLSDSEGSLLERCIGQLSNQTWSNELEIVIVADTGYDQIVLERAKQLCPSKWSIKLVQFDEEFNFSRKCNAGANVANGDVVVFLNDDIEIISKDAVSKLVELSLRDGVGAVGSKLKFSDGSIQHGGITLQAVKPRNSYLDQFPHSTITGDLEVSHEVSAVTGACIAITRLKFEMSGGWNEELHNSYNDVDLCLRLNKFGLQTIVRNDLEILHHESVSRDSSFDEESFAILKSLWPDELGNEQYLRSPEVLGIGYQGHWGINKELRVDLSGKYFQYFYHLMKTQGVIQTMNALFRRFSGKTSNLMRFESKSYL